jgi:hypothetical protein
MTRRSSRIAFGLSFVATAAVVAVCLVSVSEADTTVLLETKADQEQNGPQLTSQQLVHNYMETTSDIQKQFVHKIHSTAKNHKHRHVAKHDTASKHDSSKGKSKKHSGAKVAVVGKHKPAETSSQARALRAVGVAVHLPNAKAGHMDPKSEGEEALDAFEAATTKTTVNALRHIPMSLVQQPADEDWVPRGSSHLTEKISALHSEEAKAQRQNDGLEGGHMLSSAGVDGEGKSPEEEDDEDLDLDITEDEEHKNEDAAEKDTEGEQDITQDSRLGLELLQDPSPQYKEDVELKALEAANNDADSSLADATKMLAALNVNVDTLNVKSDVNLEAMATTVAMDTSVTSAGPNAKLKAKAAKAAAKAAKAGKALHKKTEEKAHKHLVKVKKRKAKEVKAAKAKALKKLASKVHLKNTGIDHLKAVIARGKQRVGRRVQRAQVKILNAESRNIRRIQRSSVGKVALKAARKLRSATKDQARKFKDAQVQKKRAAERSIEKAKRDDIKNQMHRDYVAADRKDQYQHQLRNLANDARIDEQNRVDKRVHRRYGGRHADGRPWHSSYRARQSAPSIRSREAIHSGEAKRKPARNGKYAMAENEAPGKFTATFKAPVNPAAPVINKTPQEVLHKTSAPSKKAALRAKFEAMMAALTQKKPAPTKLVAAAPRVVPDTVPKVQKWLQGRKPASKPKSRFHIKIVAPAHQVEVSHKTPTKEESFGALPEPPVSGKPPVHIELPAKKVKAAAAVQPIRDNAPAGGKRPRPGSRANELVKQDMKVAQKMLRRVHATRKAAAWKAHNGNRAAKLRVWRKTQAQVEKRQLAAVKKYVPGYKPHHWKKVYHAYKDRNSMQHPVARQREHLVHPMDERDGVKAPARAVHRQVGEGKPQNVVVVHKKRTAPRDLGHKVSSRGVAHLDPEQHHKVSKHLSHAKKAAAQAVKTANAIAKKAKKAKPAMVAPPSALGLSMSSASTGDEDEEGGCKSCDDLAKEFLDPTKPKTVTREAFEDVQHKLDKEVAKEQAMRMEVKFEQKRIAALEKVNNKLQDQNKDLVTTLQQHNIPVASIAVKAALGE